MLCPSCGKKMDELYDGEPDDVELDGDHLEYGCEVEFFCPDCLIGAWGWAQDDEIEVFGEQVSSFVLKSSQRT